MTGTSGGAVLRRRAVRAAIVAALLAGVIGPPAHFVYRSRYGPSARVAKLRGRAVLELQLGRAEAAAASLERAIALAPGNAELHETLGHALRAAGRRADARAALERSVALDPDAITPRLRLAEMALEERDPARARALLRWLEDPARAARLRPYREFAALLLYRAACLESDPDAAAAAAEQALAANPRSVPALLGRARIALARGNPSFARSLLESAIDRVPDDVRLRILLATAREEAGEPEAARAILEAIPEAAGAREPVAIARAELAAHARDQAGIEAAVRALPPDATPASVAYLGGLGALAKGDLARAVASFREALARNPLFAQARLELAKALLLKGDASVARAELRAVLDDDPLSRSARLQLARAAFIDKDFEAAAREAEALLRLSGRDRTAAELLVLARSRQGRAAEARRVFEEAGRKDPGNPVAEVGRNLAWLADLDLDSAIEGTESLVAERPFVAGGLEVLAAAYAAKRGLADALRRLDLLVATDPRLAPVRLELARLYAALGRADLARSELRSLAAGAPEIAEARLALASLAELEADLSGAEAEAKAYVTLRPDDAAGRAVLARVLLGSGKCGEALELAERPLPKPQLGWSRTHAYALARIGFAAAVELGALERAAGRLEAARAIDPETPVAILAAAALVLDRPAEAADALSRARPAAATAAARPLDPDAAWVSAALAFAKGDHARAAEEAAAPSAPRSVPLAILAVDARILAGDREGALREAGSLVPPAGPGEGEGPIARALRDHAAAAPPERLATLADPLHRLLLASAFGFRVPARTLAGKLRREAADLPLFALLVSRALEDLGEREEARAVLSEALGRSPRSEPLLEAYGAALVESGAYRDAAAVLERAIALAPDRPRLRFFAGLAREGLGRPSEAIEAYRRAVALDPGMALARNNLAWLLLRDQGSLEEALEEATRARDLAPEDARVLDTLGLAQLVRDRVSDALATLARARRIAPREPHVRYHLALAYRKLGDLKRAVRELEMAIVLAPESAEGVAAAKLREEILNEISGGKRPGATFETAGRLSPGDALEESLGLKGSRHLYRLEFGAPARVVLEFAGPRDAETEIHLARRDAAGPRELKGSGVPPGGTLRWRLGLRAGSHLLEVVASARTTIANYELRLIPDVEPEPAADREPNDASPEGEPLPLGATVTARLGPLADRDFFLLPESGGAPLDLRVRAPAASDLKVRLIEPGSFGDTALKEFAVRGGETAWVPSIRRPGSRIAVEVSGAPDGPYEVEASTPPPVAAAAPPSLDEPDDTPALATVLPEPKGPGPWGRRGTIAPAGDLDLVRLPPGRSSLSLRAPRDLGLLVSLRVPAAGRNWRVARAVPLAAGAALRVGSIGAPGLLIALAAAETGAASLEPYELAWGAPEPTADLEPNDDMASASPLPLGTVTAALDSPTDRDFYRPAGPRAERYRVSLRALDAPVALSLLLLSPQGEPRLERRIEVKPGRPLGSELWTPGAADGGLAVEVAPLGSPGGGYELSIVPEEAPR